MIGFSAAALLVACATASASNFGTYTADGKTMTLNSGYAWPVQGEKYTRVVLCDVDKIDAQALNAVQDQRYNALYDQIRKVNPKRNCVELQITADGQLDDLTANTMTGLHQAITGHNDPTGYKLDIKHNDAKRIEGSLHSTDELKNKKHVEFDLKFSLDVAPTASQN